MKHHSNRIPLSSYTVLMAISFFVGLLSFVTPSGTFTYKNSETHTLLPSDKAIPLAKITSEHLTPILGSYHTLEHKPLVWQDFLEAPLIGASEIMNFILFILILGVFLEILKSLRVFEKLCATLIRIHCPPSLLLIVFLFLLSILGSVTGLRDENVVFFLLLVPVLSSHGISEVVTSLMILAATSIGIASSILNPTIVGIFSTFSKEPLVTGGMDRFLLWLIGTILAAFLIWRVAPKTYGLPTSTANATIPPAKNFWRSNLSMGILLLAFITLIKNLISTHSLLETEGTLLFLSILAGVVGGLQEHKIVLAIKIGMQNLLPIAINMSIARGILYLIEKSEIRDTILFACFSVLGGHIPIWVFSLEFILLISCGFFLINSTSAMSSLAFPLLYPIFIPLGIPYSTFILWFLIATGVAQTVNPAGFLLNHIRKETPLSYHQWLRFSSPILIFLFIVWVFTLFY